MAYELDPTLDFDAQEQALLQQAARIKALRSRDLSVTPTQPDSYTSAVTGAKMLAPMVRTPKLSALAPLIQDEVAAREERQMTEQRSALSRAMQADAMKQFEEYPTGTPAKAATPDVVYAGDAGPSIQRGSPGSPAIPADKNAILKATARMFANPLTKALGVQSAEYALTKAEADKASKMLDWMKYQETVRHHGALENKESFNGFQDSGLNDKTSGAKIYSHPDGRTFSATTPLEAKAKAESMPAGAPTEIAGGYAGAQGYRPPPAATPVAAGPVASPSRAAMANAEPRPNDMDAGTRTKVTDLGQALVQVEGLHATYNKLKPSLIADVDPTNKLGQTGVFGADAQERAQFYAGMDKYTNTSLQDQAGKTVTPNELGRHNKAKPNASSNEKSWNDWFNNEKAMLKVAAARATALATVKGAYLDTEKNAVVDKYSGKVIPNTESPYGPEGKKSNFPRTNVAVNTTRGQGPSVPPDVQSKREDDRTETLLSEIRQAEAEMAKPGTKDDVKRDLQEDIRRNKRELARQPTANQPKADSPDKMLAELVATKDPERSVYLQRRLGLDRDGSDTSARITKARANGWTDEKIVQQLRSEVK